MLVNGHYPVRAVSRKTVVSSSAVQDANLIPRDLRPRESACARCGYLLPEDRLVLLPLENLRSYWKLRRTVHDRVVRVSLVHASSLQGGRVRLATEARPVVAEGVDEHAFEVEGGVTLTVTNY